MEGRRRDKGLRRGFTTGTCAAAASKASILALLTHKCINAIDITLPGGDQITLPVYRCRVDKGFAMASIIKDAGDDPDITNGAEIVARAFVKGYKGRGINISGIREAFSFEVNHYIFRVFSGIGVGVVTKPGLAVKVGEPAINPVPRRMIIDNIKDIGPSPSSSESIDIVISIPDGERLATKTMNPRLGIIGGLSILGTTGIVEPLSLSAYRQSISCAIDIASASDCGEVVLSTGRSSERAVQRVLKLRDEAFILVGDHMGFALKEVAERGDIGSVTIAGQFGKLSKLASGRFNTHSGDAGIDRGFIAEMAETRGISIPVIDRIRCANTAREMFYILKDMGFNNIFTDLCGSVVNNAIALTRGRLVIRCILVDYEGRVVGSYK